MLELISRYWWTFLIRGLAAVLFGVFAWMWPGLTIAVLVLLFGAYALVDGVFALVAAISGKGPNDSRWLVGLIGALGVLVGLMALARPAAAAIALLIYIAAWSLATGTLQLVAAIRLRKEIVGEFWLGLAGVISILFALFILFNPGAGALAVVWIIAAYAIVFGVANIVLGFKLRSHRAPAAA